MVRWPAHGSIDRGRRGARHREFVLAHRPCKTMGSIARKRFTLSGKSPSQEDLGSQREGWQPLHAAIRQSRCVQSNQKFCAAEIRSKFAFGAATPRFGSSGTRAAQTRGRRFERCTPNGTYRLGDRRRPLAHRSPSPSEACHRHLLPSALRQVDRIAHLSCTAAGNVFCSRSESPSQVTASTSWAFSPTDHAVSSMKAAPGTFGLHRSQPKRIAALGTAITAVNMETFWRRLKGR